MNEDVEVTKETVVTNSPNVAASQTRTVTRRGFMADFFVSKTNQIIFGIIAIIDLLLLLRITFLLLGANRVGVVNFIMSLTDVLVAPFHGIFPAPSSGNSYLDVAAIVAIIIWAVIGFIIGIILEWFSTSTE